MPTREAGASEASYRNQHSKLVKRRCCQTSNKESDSSIIIFFENCIIFNEMLFVEEAVVDVTACDLTLDERLYRE
jgi:hypothetical protein